MLKKEQVLGGCLSCVDSCSVGRCTLEAVAACRGRVFAARQSYKGAAKLSCFHRKRASENLVACTLKMSYLCIGNKDDRKKLVRNIVNYKSKRVRTAHACRKAQASHCTHAHTHTHTHTYTCTHAPMHTCTQVIRARRQLP